MKSQPFRFSPTSAGVRLEHLNLHNNNNANNQCCNSNSTNSYSLPRARVPKKGEALQQVIVHKSSTLPKPGKKNKQRERCSSKMRNCLIFGGVTILALLLSFVLLVECRSFKGSSKKSHHEEEDRDIGYESRVQEATLEPEGVESSEEYPGKVIATSFSTPSSTKNLGDSSTKRSSSSAPSNGRLTRSRVSVICKGGYLDEGGSFSTTSANTSPSLSPTTTSTTSTTSSRKGSKRGGKEKTVNLPVILPRESDDDEEDDESDNGSWDDEGAISSEETQQVVTVTGGYSQVTGGKPETKANKRASTTNIKYVPKPTPGPSVFTSPTASASGDDDEVEGSSSSEEGVVIEVKPRRKEKGHKSSSVTHSSRSVPTSTSSASSVSSSKGSKRDKQQRKRESSEDLEEVGDEHLHSSHSSKKGHKPTKRSEVGEEKPEIDFRRSRKNDKGDNGEVEQDDLFPALRENKRDKKSSDKRQKPVVVELEQAESAEAEPVAAVQKRAETSSKKSSRSRSSSSNNKSSAEKSKRSKASSTKQDESSEEYVMEEMPFTTPHENAKQGKTRRSHSSNSSSTRSARMSSKTTAPKLRTRTFASVEQGD